MEREASGGRRSKAGQFDPARGNSYGYRRELQDRLQDRRQGEGCAEEVSEGRSEDTSRWSERTRYRRQDAER